MTGPTLKHVTSYRSVRNASRYYQRLPSTLMSGSERAIPAPRSRPARCRASRMAILILACAILFFLKALYIYSARSGGPHVPHAKRIKAVNRYHGVKVRDDYSWLRQIDLDPDVQKYINAENKYANFALTPLESLRGTIGAELAAWEDATTLVAPPDFERGCGPLEPHPAGFFELASYIYWKETPKGKRFPVYFRRPISHNGSCDCLVASTAKATVVLDYNHHVPASAAVFVEGVFEPNVNQSNLLAFSFDLTGSENFELYLLDLNTGSISERIGETYYSVRWGTGPQAHCVYYNAIDSIWGIPRKVLESCVQRPLPETLVYVEKDVTMTTEVVSTNDGQYVFIKVVGQVTSETLVVASHGPPKPLFSRVEGTHYQVEHRNGLFYLLTNAGGAPNYQVVSVDAQAAVKSGLSIEALFAGQKQLELTTVLEQTEDEVIERIEMTESHLIAWVRNIVTGQRTFRSLSFDKRGDSFTASIPNDIGYSIFPSTISDMESRLYRPYASTCFVFSNSSFLSPSRVYTTDLRTGVTSLLAEMRVAGYDSSEFTEQRIWAPSLTEKSVRIPVSLIRPKNSSCDAEGLLLTSYGAYGTYTDPAFSTNILPLLKRGITFAMCHPRGDGNLGPSWYEGGKYAMKQNTFDDVGACLRALVDRGLAKPGRVAVYGRSAGGLIAGNVVNNYAFTDPGSADPDAIVKVVVAQVPFVDPIGDMTDETVPWTPYEFFEWGNPLTSASIFHSMRAYSPYENMPTGDDDQRRTGFPALYVSTGLVDPRVGFWEPIKWVAKLRARYDDKRQHELVLRVGDEGHFSTDSSEWMAFVVHHLFNGIGDP